MVIEHSTHHHAALDPGAKLRIVKAGGFEGFAKIDGLAIGMKNSDAGALAPSSIVDILGWVDEN